MASKIFTFLRSLLSFVALIKMIDLFHIHLAHAVMISKAFLRSFKRLDGIPSILRELFVVIMHGRFEVVREKHRINNTVIVNCKVLLST